MLYKMGYRWLPVATADVPDGKQVNCGRLQQLSVATNTS